MPCLDKNLFGPVGSAGGGGGTDIGSEFLEGMILADCHATKGVCGMHGLGARGHGVGSAIQGLVFGSVMMA